MSVWPGSTVVVPNPEVWRSVALAWIFFILLGVVLVAMGMFSFPIIDALIGNERHELFYTKHCVDGDICTEVGVTVGNTPFGGALPYFLFEIAFFLAI
jgi:hypothetical protein